MNPSAHLTDRLGPLEPPYRSRGEAQIGRLLDRYGIPFFYEQPTIVYDRGRYRCWHPDFTLPTRNGLVVEYAGMPDRPDYMQGLRRKQRAYRRNEIPAVFFYPTELKQPRWPDRVMARILGAYDQGRTPTYRGTPYAMAPRRGYSGSGR